MSATPYKRLLVTHNVPQCTMPSVNIRQLRDTRRLKGWLRAGKTVELRERDRVIARIIPEKVTAKSQGNGRTLKPSQSDIRRSCLSGPIILMRSEGAIEHLR